MHFLVALTERSRTDRMQERQTKSQERGGIFLAIPRLKEAAMEGATKNSKREGSLKCGRSLAVKSGES
jgi:hypothetical protein